MKIVEMQIYGYGQLENVHISNLTDFQVFFGENEAGKSTIMAFIHGILFGFPTKQQSSELRYEPKHNSKYGGKIKIHHEEIGFAVIERVKGKATGDVTVTLENGIVGGEDLLKEIVANLDKNLFQAIFSFNLHGLQNIHQMKGEEIGKFLFSAGTLGTERLAQAETGLQKELDARFKPGGKKPFLNEKLHELHDLNGELKKASAKNQEYEHLIEKKETLQHQMIEIDKSLHQLQEKLEKLSEWKKINLLVKEEKWTTTEINQLGDIQFPARGIERLEKLTQLFLPYHAQISSIAERINNLEKELESHQPDMPFLDQESAILTILDQIPIYDQLKLEKQQCETRLKELEEKLAVISEKLHLPFNEEEIFAVNTNIYMKNQVELVSRKGQKLLEAKQELESRFNEEKNSLEEIEKDVRLAKSQILSEMERNRLEDALNERNNKKALQIEAGALKDKIEFYQEAVERDKNFQKQKRTLLITLELILFGLAVYGVLTKQWILTIICVLGCLIAAVFMVKSLGNAKKNNAAQTLNNLREKENQLIKKLQSAEYMDISVLEEQLLLDQRRREQLQLLKFKLEQQQSQYEKVILKFEEWELASVQHKQKLGEISSELRIPEYMANSYLLDAFQLIEQYKIIGREKQQLVARLDQIHLEQIKTVEELHFYTNQYLSEQGIDLHKSAYLLRDKLKEEHEKQIKSAEKKVKLNDLKADIQQLQTQEQHVSAEMNKLLSEAQVENEQQYFELGNKAEKKVKLVERLGDIQKQLQFSLLSESERESFLHIYNYEELIRECIDQAQIQQGKLKRFQEELASINYEIQVLEEGGMYSNQLHQFKQKKYELEEEAKEWAVYCIAQDLLSKTIEKYKNVHLPRMLAKAEEYLLFLTEGNYHKIHLKTSGTGFLIERKDHTLFEANELSQATTEQVYVAIRLALATTLYENYHLPIMIDDSFVNFDARRTEKVIKLLKGLKQNQILFFTCHTHILSYFHKDNVLCLENGAVQIIS
ncbi:MAG TPA: AAA family ATPase [Neobacillus sp.]